MVSVYSKLAAGDWPERTADRDARIVPSILTMDSIPQQTSLKTTSWIQLSSSTWVWPGAVLVLAAALRLFRLGANSFWIDEIGVAVSARAASIPELLRISHNHVMAMPLDYIVDWVFARVGMDEFTLRLPSVIWGILALAAGYAFYKKLVSPKAALLGMLIFTLSPIHIQYSQELRFYSALILFYLSSSWLLLRAIEEPAPKRWAAWTFLTILGIFFHVYVLLAVIHGIIWLWFVKPDHLGDRLDRSRRYFIRGACVVIFGFIIALVAFGSVYPYDIPLLLDESSFMTILGIALGWIPFYGAGPSLAWVWGGLCLGFAAVGILRVILKNPKSIQAGLFYSAVLQAILIVGLNALKHYFLSPRQFLIFLPLLILFTAIGIETTVKGLGSWISARFARKASAASAFAVILCLAPLFISAFPALANYYQGDKGLTQEINRVLQQAWKPTDRVLVIPNFDAQLFDYYLKDDGAPPAISAAMFGTDWDALDSPAVSTGNEYLITHSILLPQQQALLASLSFRPLFVPTEPNRYSHTLWYRAAQ